MTLLDGFLWVFIPLLIGYAVGRWLQVRGGVWR